MTKKKRPIKASAKDHNSPVHPEPGRISAADFTAWQASLGLSSAAAARALGISENSALAYKADGAPPYVAMACAAVAAGLPPYTAKVGKRLQILAALNRALDV